MSRLDKHSDVIGATLPEQAFRPIGKRMTLEGGGSGGGKTTSTTYTSSLPQYAEPYFRDVMGRAQQASVQPFQEFGGERVAGFTPTQEAAMGLTAQTALGGTPAGLQAGQNLMGLAAGQAAGFQYSPTQFDPSQIAAGQLGPQLSMADPSAVSQFMSPYMQQVVDVEKQAAQRDYQLAQQQRAAQAVGAGAFGGSRQAVMEAEAQRGLMSQLQGIQARGTQSAFEQAQQALEAQRGAEMQAGTTNIQAALQAAQSNQQAMMEAQRQSEASRQFGASTGLQASGLLGELGLGLGRMGEAEQSLALARSQALAAVGQQEQELAQRQLDQAYADFAAARDYEQNMINWYTSILYGQPISMDQAVYRQGATPSLASQLGGLGIAGLGVYGAMR